MQRSGAARGSLESSVGSSLATHGVLNQIRSFLCASRPRHSYVSSLERRHGTSPRSISTRGTARPTTLRQCEVLERAAGHDGTRPSAFSSAVRRYDATVSGAAGGARDHRRAAQPRPRAAAAGLNDRTARRRRQDRTGQSRRWRIVVPALTRLGCVTALQPRSPGRDDAPRTRHRRSPGGQGWWR